MNSNYLFLKEQLPHGNLMFPLMVHEVQTDTSQKDRLFCHWHEEIEILIVTKGSVAIQVDEKRFNMREGDFIFIPPNCLHSAQSQVGADFDFFAIVFSKALLDSSLNDRIQQQYINCWPGETAAFPVSISPENEWEKEVYALLCEIRSAFSTKEPAFELLIKIKLYQVWYLLYLNASGASTYTEKYLSERVYMVKSILSYIAQHYDSPISVPKLADYFHLSEGHLCRFFKSMTKMSIVEYINYYRIGKSVEYLGNTRLAISSIALQTGFNNISYFNKIFKKYMNMTPSQYRKEFDRT